MINGYMGTLLRIDLNDKSLHEQELKIEDVKQFIGGTGLGAKILFDETDGKTDPLGTKNVLIYLTGPFAGSPVPTSGRHHIIAKSPLTGIWGESDVGGEWGVSLKRTGYDGLVIKGSSDHPVYIHIGSDGAEIKDARDLWGKDTYEAKDVIQKELGERIAISCSSILIKS